MLNQKVEIILSIVLLLLLIVVVTPLMVDLFHDVLPTNKNIDLDEFIQRLTDDKSNVEFIESNGYLYIIETKKDNEIVKHFAYKGKTSGYIPTAFTLGTGERIKRKSDLISVGDLSIRLIMKKHKDNYIIEIITYYGVPTLFDDMGNEIGSIGPRFFHVIEGDISDDWEICGKQNDFEFKLLDKVILMDYMGDK